MAQQYQPAYYQPQTRPGNGFGVTALVLGIIGLVLALIPIVGFLAFILGPVAIIFGIVGLVQVNRPKGMAVAGMILGAASVVLAIIVTSAIFGAVSSATDEAQSVAVPVESSAPVESEEAAAPAPPAADVVAVEASRILEEFDANEASADQKYAGKTLEVTGSVHKVDTEILNDTQYVVRLNDGAEYSFATVNCNDVPTEQAVAAIAGSTVSIRGAFDDGGDFGVEIKDCVIL